MFPIVTNNVVAVVEYIRECESVPQLVEKYGNVADYARINFGCSHEVASLIMDRLAASPKSRRHKS